MMILSVASDLESFRMFQDVSGHGCHLGWHQVFSSEDENGSAGMQKFLKEYHPRLNVFDLDLVKCLLICSRAYH